MSVLTQEQKQVIDKLIQGNNVSVNAVAGSGKSTTIFGCVQHFPNEKHCVLTYSKDLSDEGKKKIKKMKLSNVDIYTYHSFANQYYQDKPGLTKDIEMINAIKTNKKPKKSIKYDKFYIDEAQDLTILYYKFIHKILSDNDLSYQLVILGDQYQNLYESMKKSSSLFLTRSDILFNFNDKKWKHVQLSESFRITKPIAKFVNTLLGYERMVSNKDGEKVKYVLVDNLHQQPYEILSDIIDKEKIDFKNITVISSVCCFDSDSQTPIKAMIKKMATKYSIQSPETNHQKKSSIKLNKMCFETLHSQKGSEDEVIVYLGFDNNQEIYSSQSLATQLKDPHYVALTRAKKKLIIFVTKEQQYSWVQDKLNVLSNYVEIIDKTKPINDQQKDKSKNFGTNINLGVVKLIKTLESDIQNRLYNCLSIKKIQQKEKELRYEEVIYHKHKDIYEGTDYLLGTSITAMVQGRNNYMLRELKQYFNSQLDKYLEQLKDIKQQSSQKFIDIQKLKKQNQERLQKIQEIEKLPDQEYYFKLTTYYKHYIDKINCLVQQIYHYKWMNQENFKELQKRINAVFNTQKYEVEQKDDTNIINNIIITGICDVISPTTIYEIKCCKNLDQTHFLQLAVYLMIQNNQKSGHLFNVLNNEQYEVQLKDYKQFKNILQEYLYSRFYKNQYNIHSFEDLFKEFQKLKI